MNIKIKQVGNLEIAVDYWLCECESSISLHHKKSELECSECGKVFNETEDWCGVKNVEYVIRLGQ
jgi:hypothetical protein